MSENQSVSCDQGNHTWCTWDLCGCDCHRQGVLPFDSPTARDTDPDTSHAAAAPTKRKDSMRARLLAAYATGRHLTAEEAAAAAGYTPAEGAWKRVSDLITAGLVEDTGQRRIGSSGRLQRVLRAAG